MKRAKAILSTGLFVLAGIGLGGVGSYAIDQLRGTPGAIPPIVVVEAEFLDEPDPFILYANLTPRLVQWGTDSPYTGNGPPGIRLHVETEGDVLDWTLVAWANETIPQTLTFCSERGVFYDENDWLYQSDREDSETGVFVTVPTTVPARLGAAGDQCHLRLRSVGIWEVEVCIEKDGLPLHRYRAKDGTLHYDPFDRCVGTTVQV